MGELENFGDFLLGDQSFLKGAAAGLAASALADEDPIQGFFEAVRRNTQDSLGAEVEVVGEPAIIVLSDDARTEVRKLSTSAKRLWDIDMKSPDEWQGKILFCASHGSGGWLFPIVGTVDDGLQSLDDGGFGGHPVVVVYPEKRMLKCYPEGIGSGAPPMKLPLPAASLPVTIENIFTVLEEARVKSLMIPASALDLWNEPATYTPSDQAERRVQLIAHAWLSAYFRPTLIEIEQNTSVGRIDLIFVEAGAVALAERHPAVLELKVLRSKTQNGKPYSRRYNELGVVKGIRQAKAYRRMKNARLGVLACFDMRQVKEDLLSADGVCLKARQRYFGDDADLALRFFAVYGDPEDAHEEMAA